MEKNVLITLAAIVLAASACSSGTGKMTMNTQTDMEHFGGKVQIFLGGKGTATLDWGDGTEKETHTLSDYTELTHSYSEASAHTITVIGKNVTRLNCNWTQLTALDVSMNTELKKLDCGNNDQLTTLDVSKNTALEELVCSGIQLTALDVSENTELTYLACNGNLLTSLDVNRNTELEQLDCSYNRLISLDVSKNTKLIRLNCSGNELSAAALNSLFETLRTIPDSNDNEGIIDISYTPGMDDCNTGIAKNKRWYVDIYEY